MLIIGGLGEEWHEQRALEVYVMEIEIDKPEERVFPWWASNGRPTAPGIAPNRVRYASGFYFISRTDTKPDGEI